MAFHQDAAKVLEQIGQMMDLLGEDSFKASAHARAARALGDLPFDLATIAGDKAKLLEIDGVGQKIADKIVELRTTGRIREHDELRKRVPAGLLEVLGVPGLGPKTVRVMWQQAGVTDLASLKRALDDGSLVNLPRMGAKSVEKIRQSLAFAAEGAVRLALGAAMPIAELIVSRMRAVRAVKDAAYAGSLRRGRDTIGDIDVLVATADGGPVARAFVEMPEVERVIAAGEKKSSVLISTTKVFPDSPVPHGTVQADLRIVPPDSWGAALMYFTGSKDHNVALRERALKAGLTLNEYGLFPDDREKTPPQERGVTPVAGKTEEQIYAALKLPYIPPEIREDRGELDLTETPRLVELADIKAELHAHTTASDGVLSIAELAAAAKARGFHTVAVTDHSASSAIANGLKPDRLRRHVEAIARARGEVEGITILAGSEVDILTDGRLDYDDETLALLDIVIASPHAALSQEPAVATKRLLRAIENPFVRILGHPTGRLINRRAGLAPDMGEVVAAAKEHGVALEINAHWMRLDLRDVHVKAAVDAGCLIAVNCDVHAPADFDNLRFGVATARRGWVTPRSCINAWDCDTLGAWLRSKARAGKDQGGGRGHGSAQKPTATKLIEKGKKK